MGNYTHFLEFPRKVRSYFRTTTWMERCFKDKDEKYRSRSLRYSDEIQEALSGYELSGGKKSDTINLTLPKSNARREFRIKGSRKRIKLSCKAEEIEDHMRQP
ncbi:MAG: hypothetical protein DRP50_04575 [Thermotoga sp.]|nr:MAG: hypothetical protein DRP50_04575 [Thermotoga sp.]